MGTKISIIIPIYNVEQFVEECLNSVVKQNAQNGLECILVDDCSKDNSISVVENYISKYTGPIVFSTLHHKQNKGLSAARNTGIKHANGEYILFLDSDDKLFPNSISGLLNISEKYPDAEMIQGSTSPGFELSRKDKPEYSNNVNWIRNGLCTLEITDPAWNKLVKRDFIIKNNLYFVEGYIQEDTLWNYQVQKHISSIAFCFETTYWYRYNPNGIMNGLGKERGAKSFARVFNYVFHDLIQCDKIEPYEIKYLIWNAKRVVGYIGKIKGLELLVIQNNHKFKKAIRWSTSLSRIHSSNRIFDLPRMAGLWFINIFILSPIIKKLCNKKNLMKGFVDIDYSQPI